MQDSASDPLTTEYLPERFWWGTEADPPLPGQGIRLRGGGCGACGWLTFPTQEVCIRCGGFLEDRPLSSEGSLLAVTEVLHPPPDGRTPVPYAVGEVELADGLVVYGLVVQPPPPQTVPLPVVTVAHAPFDGGLTFAFRPAGQPT